MGPCEYKLKLPPNYTTTRYELNAHEPLWSGQGQLSLVPSRGALVDVLINGFGLGTVVSYFVEHGYLGVEVKLRKMPAALKLQRTRQDEADLAAAHTEPGTVLVFGREIGVPPAKKNAKVAADHHRWLVADLADEKTGQLHVLERHDTREAAQAHLKELAKYNAWKTARVVDALTCQVRYFIETEALVQREGAPTSAIPAEG